MPKASNLLVAALELKIDEGKLLDRILGGHTG